MFVINCFFESETKLLLQAETGKGPGKNNILYKHVTVQEQTITALK